MEGLGLPQRALFSSLSYSIEEEERVYCLKLICLSIAKLFGANIEIII